MTTGKILVTGADGLVGSQFVSKFPQPALLDTPGLDNLDFTKPGSITDYVHLHHPSVILHLAAWTDVSGAEKQRGDKEGICWKINVSATRELLEAAQSTSAFFLFMSTDMVFPGSAGFPGPYSENSSPVSDHQLLNWYGQSKLAAEHIVAESGGSIVRICNPVRAGYPAKLDYLRKPLSLYNQGKLYPLFNDQHITISFIDEIALGLQKIITNRLSGIFHISSSNTTTPHEVVSYLIGRLYGDAAAASIKSTSISSLENPQRYPQFSGLVCKETESRLNMKFKTWQETVDELVKQGIK